MAARLLLWFRLTSQTESTPASVYSNSLAQLRSSLLCLTLQTQSLTARVRSQSPSRRPPINQSTAGSVSWLPSIFAALAGVQATDFLAATGSESLCPCLEGNS